MSTPKSPFHIEEDRPTDWFETLYSNADTDGAGVPWANMDTHPAFKAWLDRTELAGHGKTALVVGCGMGDDAIALEGLGFEVTAFDVSDTAIALCKERFPDSAVRFTQANLLDAQPQWHRAFDFVLEIFTVQAMPPKYEAELIESIANFVAPGGQILVVAETGPDPRSFDNGPPWVLTPDHVAAFEQYGLSVETQVITPSDFARAKALYVTSFRRTR